MPETAESGAADRRRMLAALQRARLRIAELEARESEPIAVVGMGLRFPGAAGPAAFWRLLREGVDAVGEVPAERWDAAALFHPEPGTPGRICTRRGGFLGRVDGFDPALFGISPREAARIDPQQRLLLEVAWETLEEAGWFPARAAAAPVGVFVGLATHDYADLASRAGEVGDGAGVFDVAGISGYAAAGRIAHTFGFTGPSLVLDTACSSSLLAVHLACQSLRRGECSAALAGGVNLILAPDVSIALSRARMLSPAGRCRTFDAAADGFVRGEGCGLVLLKRLSDAQAAGDRVRAVVRGSAVNHDGRSSGFTVPNGTAQERVIRQALREARVAPAEIGYVEAHGTGTALGDPIEVGALGRVFGAGRAAESPLVIGSVKTNVGHLEGAAGVAGLIKAVLCVEQGEIPPHLHCATPNPAIPWESWPVEVPAGVRTWPGGAEVVRRAGVSSFGASGTNVHVVVEQAPGALPGEGAKGERPAHVLALSARTPEALAELAGRWAEHLERHPELAAGDVAHTALVGRSRQVSRLAVVAGDTAEMAAGLRAVEQASGKEGVWTGRAPVEAPAVALLFTGQGSQYRGMGEDLEGEPVFREALDRCSAVLDPVLGLGLREVLWGPEESLLEQTRWAQPALVALEWSLAELWRSWGVEASAVLGHSVGELTAAVVAGALDLEAGLRFAAERGRRMQEAPGRGGMLAVSAEESEVSDLLGPEVGVAAVNGRRQVVLSGWAETLSGVGEKLQARGVESRRLPVSHGFHSVQMDGMLGGLEEWLGGVELRQPDRWLVSGVTGAPVGEEVRTVGYWRRQAREPVRFAAGMEHLWAAGYRVFLEVGPQPTLVSLGRRTVDPEGTGRWLASLRRGAPGVRTLLASLGELFVAGVAVDGAGLDRGRPRRRLALPTYPFQRQRCWIESLGAPRPLGAAHRPEPHPESEHPLLGRRLDLPGLDESRYECRLGAGSAPWLRGHRVGGRAVMPASGHYALALAAGGLELGTDRLAIEEAEILRPLVLPEDGRMRLQTVAGRSAGRFRIYAEDEAGWRIFAQGVVRPVQGPDPEPVEVGSWAVEDPLADLAELRERALAHGVEVAGLELVQELRRRGPRVRARLLRPAGEAGGGWSPGLYDLCVQLLGAGLEGDAERFVQTGLDRLTVRGELPRELWMEGRLHAPEGGADAGRLRTGELRVVDAAGRELVRVEGLRFQPLPEGVAVGRAPWEEWLYTLAWQPRPRFGVGGLAAPAGIARRVGERLAGDWPRAELAAYEAACERLEARARGHLRRALAELGWRPEAGEEVTAGALAERLGIVPRFGRWLGRALEILAEEGLSRAGEGWVVTRPAALAPADLPAVEDGPEAVLLERCGSRLAEVLRGEVDPLSLLFPGNDLSTAIQLYEEAAGSRAMNRLAREAVACLLADLPAGRGLRVLEVGAGTGGTTSALLPLCDPGRVEYVFTDLGPLFLARARERFAGYGFLELRTLDLEQPPEGQGFDGGSFDLVIATNVLHAVRDLAESLGHVRRLLAPGGQLLMTEGRSRLAWIDLTFGLSEGWWRFADFGLRPDYPLATPDVWRQVLEQSGFAALADLAEEAERHGPPLRSSAWLAGAGAAAPRSWWLFAPAAADLGPRLAAALGGRGDRCSLVRTGSGGLDLRDPRAVAGAVRELAAAGVADEVVACHGVAAVGEELTTLELEGLVAEVVGGALHLVQAVLELPGPPPRLTLVTRGAQSVAGDAAGAPLHVAQAPLWGLGKTAALEHPELAARLVDLDPAADEEAAVRDLLAELAVPRGEREHAAVRGGRAHVLRLRRAAPPRAPRPALRPDAAYLVTGGLHGIGLRVARWLAGQGARHLVLLGRRPPSDAARAVLAELAAAGAAPRVVSADVADPVALERALAEIAAAGPPLAGVIHSAGSFEDRLLRRHEWELFARVLAPKVSGAWNLHRLLADRPLDFFVLFSSGSSLIGAAGLGNYVAANAFEDALAHLRRRRGLPALAINWGPWREVGMAAAVGERRERQWVVEGVEPMAPEAALAALGALLGSAGPQTGVLAVHWPRFLAQHRSGPFVGFLAEMRREAGGAAGPAAVPRIDLAGLAPAEARRRLERWVSGEVAHLLGFAAAGDVDPDLGLFEQGLDSLLSLELRNRLQAGLDHPLPSTLLFKHPQVRDLVDHLATDVLALGGVAARAAAPESGAAAAPEMAAALSEAEIAVLLRDQWRALEGEG